MRLLNKDIIKNVEKIYLKISKPRLLLHNPNFVLGMLYILYNKIKKKKMHMLKII